MVEVDTGVRVVSREHESDTPTTVGARCLLYPRFQGHRESCHALSERAPGLRVCGIGVVQRLRVDGDFVEPDFPGLLVEAICPAPQHPLGAGLESGRYAGEVLSRRAGVEGAVLGHDATSPRFRVSIRSEACAMFAGGGPASPRAVRYASCNCEGGFPAMAWRRACWRRAWRSAGGYWESHCKKCPQ